MAFEHSLDALSVDYTDGFTGFVNRQFDPRALSDDCKTTLIKIHGSVNWIEDDFRIKELQPRFIDGRACIQDTKPVLIYPTSSKLYQTYTTPYSELMRYMCSRFLAIPEEEIKGMLNALGVQYPAVLVNYFERFIDKMRKFCQK